MIKHVIAFFTLAVIYMTAKIAVVFSKLIPRRKWQPSGCIIVTGTFFNPNWFISHAQPLSQCGMRRVIFVTDTVHPSVSGIEFICPPRWASKLFSRAGAKFIWMFIAGLRFNPDFYIGYHIFPSAVSALMIAKLLGRPSCFQMCAGPVEIIGGGIYSENALMTKLRSPSPLLENLSMSIVREFELIAVRGSNAKSFLIDRGVAESRIAIIPGSIKLNSLEKNSEREYDIVFVGRLAEIKQPLQIIEIVNLVKRSMPQVCAAVVGDGPLSAEMKNYAYKLGVSKSIEMLGQRSDVESILGRSKVFLLTSRNEGLSIAMAEAMAQGAVPVVADVGDLSDLVKNGINGFLVEPNNIQLYANRIVSLLSDRNLWVNCSDTATTSARQYNGIDVVSSLWRENIKKTTQSQSI